MQKVRPFDYWQVMTGHDKRGSDLRGKPRILSDHQ
jgi:hypothetical protein